MKRSSKALALTAVGALAGAALGGAGTNVEILVTATRLERKAGDIPANVTVMTAEEIRTAGHASVVDALRSVSGLQVRSSSGNDATAEVSMRGFGENAHGRVLVLLDGRRLNRPDMAGINWLQVPISNVSRIEVVRGSGSSMYGDGAVAGVINIVTAGGDEGPGLSIEAMAGSHGQASVRAGASGGGGGVRYAANAEHYELDGYRARSAFASRGGGARATWHLGDAARLSAALSAQDVSYEMPGPLTAAQMTADRRQSMNPDDSAQDRYINADIGFDAEPSDNQRAAVHVVFGRKDIRTDMTSWTSFNDLIVDTVGVQPRYEIRGDLFGAGHLLTIGADGYWDSLDVDRFGDKQRAAALMGADVKRRTIGAYAREEATIAANWKLGIGGRLEFGRLDADVLSADGATDIDQTKTCRVSAGELSVVRTMGRNGRLFTRAATVYRLPFVDEQVSYYGFGTDVFYTDIEPETGWTVEAGGVVRAGHVTGSLTLFRLNMRDEIAYDNAAYRNRNMDETRHDGAEVQLEINAASWCRLDLRYALTRAVFGAGQYECNDIPLVPEHQASGRFCLQLPAGVSLDTTVSYTGRAYLGGDYANAGGRLAAYTTVDVLARYSPRQCEGIEVSAGVNNLFDQEYSNLGYLGWDGTPNYYPSPERTLKVGVAWRY
jgi:iron complex outermembrane receptor protein